MDETNPPNAISWLQQRMRTLGLSVADLAARATLPLRVLRNVFDGGLAETPGLTVRQTFTLAEALEADPVQMITDLDMLSEQGRTYLPYCQACSEAPLGELWQSAKGLSDQDRIVLLEYVLHQRRRRWEASDRPALR